ncbi:substrate-binding domain-containing protein [Bradyrhizobium sp. HKCCYLS2038]|uniref:substrate-binding domain-containing protein n=1 Tax=unclassified Bradyrhizobium TaxID=2631580 RepID=UPI003EBD8839
MRKQADTSIQRVTIRDIAREIHVSTATVSNALTGQRPVDPATRQRVMDAAARLGYTPNLRARQLRTGRADTIAIFSSMPSSIAGGRSRLGFLLELAGSAAEKALQRGIALMLIPPLEAGWGAPRDFHIDGAIVVEPHADDPEVAALRQRNLPVVTIGRQPDARDIACVDLRSAAATTMMLQHLFDQQVRNMALIIGSERRNSYLEARQAYQHFVRRKRMRPAVIAIDETGGEDAACAATAALLQQRPEIDGIYASVDVFASGALRAINQSGRRVPADVKLATRYDGFHARDSIPPITAFDMRLSDVGAAAVDLLLRQMHGDEAAPSLSSPEPQLIQRESSRSHAMAHRAG